MPMLDVASLKKFAGKSGGMGLKGPPPMPEEEVDDGDEDGGDLAQTDSEKLAAAAKVAMTKLADAVAAAQEVVALAEICEDCDDKMLSQVNELFGDIGHVEEIAKEIYAATDELAKAGAEELDDEVGEGGPASEDQLLAQTVAEDVEAGEVDPELMQLMASFDPANNPPEWVADEDTWERAKEAVDPEGKGAAYDNPWAVVAHTYKAMGGSTK